MFYKRFCKTLADKGLLISFNENPMDYIDDPNTDYYVSLFDYDQKQYWEFQKKGSVAGIKDVSTSVLLWDFDNETDLENAKLNAVALCTRLLKHGVNQKDIRIYFSGKKGFCVQVDTDQRLTVQEFKNICFGLADGLDFDTQIYNSNRVIRLKGTKHQDSGLFKYPLTYGQLCEFDIAVIKDVAKDLSNVDTSKFDADTITLPKSIDELRGRLAIENKQKQVNINIRETKELSWKDKPKFLTNCRWALQNGFFEEGMRSNAFVTLCATYKNLGYDEEITFRMLKGVSVLQAEHHKCERFSDVELYNNVVRTVYSPTWEGGQYTCKDENSWLGQYCLSLGDHKCNHEDDKGLDPKTIMDVYPAFKDMVVNLDQNIIRTGIEGLDDKLFITTNSYVLLLGAPSSGKTSIAIDILSNTSKNKINSVFASFDMARTRLFQKICQRASGLDQFQLFETFQQNKEAGILEQVNEMFSHVKFMSKSCPTVKELKQYIVNCNAQMPAGEKIKLVVVDYFEKIMGETTDETMNSKRVSGELRDLIDDLGVCLVIIVQPNKAALDQGVNVPLWEYTRIKGSSSIYQDARQILSCWRPFYSPKDFSKDKYMEMAVIKNDMGELSHHVLNWNGKRGLITKMVDTDKSRYEQWMAEATAAKEEQWGKKKSW